MRRWVFGRKKVGVWKGESRCHVAVIQLVVGANTGEHYCITKWDIAHCTECIVYSSGNYRTVYNVQCTVYTLHIVQNV